jgi:hypothetical protein
MAKVCICVRARVWACYKGGDGCGWRGEGDDMALGNVSVGDMWSSSLGRQHQEKAVTWVVLGARIMPFSEGLLFWSREDCTCVCVCKEHSVHFHTCCTLHLGGVVMLRCPLRIPRSSWNDCMAHDARLASED